MSESKKFLEVLLRYCKVDKVDKISQDLLTKSPQEGLARFLIASARAVEGFVELETENSKLKGQLIIFQDSVIMLQKQREVATIR